MRSVAIIGAGLAGVSAGRAVKREGVDVTVFDKGRRPGGRCSSKRPKQQYDHGAQYVTATDPRFVATLAELEARGDIAQWRGHFVTPAAHGTGSRSGPVRYVGVPSMSRLVNALAEPLDVLTQTRIADAAETSRGWRLWDADGSDLGEYDALLLAMPPEQARSLAPRGSPIHTALCAFRSVPCWAAMLAFEAPLPLSFDGAAYDHEVIAWAARDSGKPGREPGERWVIHARADWSRDRFGEDPAVVATELADGFRELTGLEGLEIASSNAHRWGLARVENGPRPGALWDEDLRLGACGDWCIAPNLEGAWLSGLEAAAQLTAGITPGRREGASSMPDDAVSPA